MDGRSDHELVTAAQAGDRDAMDMLLRRHYDRIWSVCRRIAGNDADAADATQEALLLIVRRIGTFEGSAKFTTWAHRVATNACLDELRRKQRRPAPGLTDDDEGDVRVTVDGSPAPDAIVAGRIDVDAALQSLPEEFRVPVILRDLVGHDYAEISTILNIPAGTVRSRIARGRSRLAQILTLDPEPVVPASPSGPTVTGLNAPQPGPDAPGTPDVTPAAGNPSAIPDRPSDQP